MDMVQRQHIPICVAPREGCVSRNFFLFFFISSSSPVAPREGVLRVEVRRKYKLCGLFIQFIALILRCRKRTDLKDCCEKMIKRPKYMTVAAALKVMIEALDADRFLRRSCLQNPSGYFLGGPHIIDLDQIFGDSEHLATCDKNTKRNVCRYWNIN